LLSFLSIIGIWKMKSIALFIFLSVFIVNHLILITLNEFDICQSLISAIIIIVGFYYLKKMN
jgi:hypothetical protein